MASCPRSKIVLKHKMGVYHCWNRCVRRAFLCGRDPLTETDYSHRRDWLLERQEQLAGLMAIEIGCQAILANHFHVLLRTRPDVARRWGREEVARRWLTLTRLAKAADSGVPEPDERKVVALGKDKKRIEKLRKRLSSVSWLMGVLCENIARRANNEDDCKGRFFETRFRSRACTDESAILACAIYIDLNQIRAGEAATPETSRFTSAYQRIRSRGQRGKTLDGWLCALTLKEGAREDRTGHTTSRSGRRASDKGLLPISLDDYLKLLDWTGRQFRRDTRGAIPSHLAPILDRLAIRPTYWLELIEHLDEWYCHAVGKAQGMADMAEQMGVRWLKGMPASRRAMG